MSTPPNVPPELRAFGDWVASEIDALKRRRLDFPDDKPVPDCFGCLCQGVGLGSHTGLSTSSTSPALHNTNLNTSRTIDCVQGGGVLAADSSQFVANADLSLWYYKASVEFTHSGSGLRTAELLLTIPDDAVTVGNVRVPGVTETGTGEILRIESDFVYPMYRGFAPSIQCRAWAASGTFDVNVSVRVFVLYQMLYDGF